MLAAGRAVSTDHRTAHVMLQTTIGEGGKMKIGDKKVDKWRTLGLVVKEGLLTEDELRAALADLDATLPLPAKGAARPGPEVMESFPFAGAALNEVALHPEFLSLCERALETSRPMLAESRIVATVGGSADAGEFRSAWDELDSILPPPSEPSRGLVVTVVPYTDLTDDTGPVEVLIHVDGGEAAEPEVVSVPRGSAIVLQGGTRYRLRPVAADSVRILHITVYSAADRLEVPRGHHLRATPKTAAFLRQASKEQLAAVGFPPADDPYWSADDATAVAALAPAVAPEPEPVVFN
jgi:hypothetical protein